MKRRRRILVVLGASLWAVFLAGAAWGQDPAPESSITVTLVESSAGSRNLILRVAATEVTDLYGLSFSLEFPKKRLRWLKKSSKVGEFLSGGDGIETVVLDRQRPRGLLHVGVSRLGEVEGASGSGVVLEIGFLNRKKGGPRELTLIEPQALDSMLRPLPEIVWSVSSSVSPPGG